MSKFERVDLKDKIDVYVKDEGVKHFRNCHEHETLMSFCDDSDNYEFRKWWGEEGSKLFMEWMSKKNKI